MFSDAVDWVGSIFKSGDQSSKVQYGYRIFGNGENRDWEKGLPTAMEGSESLDLGSWLEFAGGLREGETVNDVWQKTLNYYRMQGVKISNDAKQIETAAQYISNTASNLLESVGKMIDAKEQMEKMNDVNGGSQNNRAKAVDIYSNGASPKNRSKFPNAIKNAADPSKPDTNYYNQPVRKGS